jgi:peroxiredoxin
MIGRMVAINSFMVPLGTPAPDFSLRSFDGATVALADFAKAPALLVAFLCNHCPYVKHIESALGPLIAELDGEGLATVGICSNDLDNYPQDGPEGMREQAARAGWSFPYLLDEDQSVALAYRAACTPDFFLYGPDRTLVWRGQFDSSRPKSGVPLTGETLRDAVEHTLAGRPVPEPHAPSLGCNIKWKPGNEPA